MSRHGEHRELGADCADRRCARRESRRGFTLIEMLVVLAVATVLMSFLAPTMLGLRSVVWRIYCESNQRQLTFAWAKYALEKRVLPVSNTGGVEAWQRSSDFGDTYDALTQGSLWPYAQDIALYHCQASVYPYKVSYSLSARLRGEASLADTFQAVPDPGNAMVFIEEYDNRGYNMNSFLLDPANYNWIDVVAGNHQQGDNLAFADGHVEYWKWLDPRTLTFAGGHYASAPGSVDLDRLNRVYNLW